MRVSVYTTNQQTEQPIEFRDAYVDFYVEDGVEVLAEKDGTTLAYFDVGQWTSVRVTT